MTHTVLWSALILLLVACSSWAGSVYAQRRKLRAVTRATFLAAQAAGIPTYRSLLHQLPAELNRARRYGRRLAVLVFKLEIVEADPAVHGRNGNRERESLRKLLLNAAFVSYVLREALRSSDLVSYDPELDQFVIVLPETEREQAEFFCNRQIQRASERLGTKLRVGVAEFPVNGTTFEATVQMARHQCLGFEGAAESKLTPAQSVASRVVTGERELA